ncbi:substrate-binding domain-containing protein [Anabaena sp. UHCC 0204]|uniref:substrate-binding domain-containing protein n=1 Tax=Anabaena sp. UHCC 0204 TaxID=2590009 RepID=UPI001444AB58|nr:phosphate ABC transporter substrate-binding protein [Anabaena sp. UHCC 0204]
MAKKNPQEIAKNIGKELKLRGTSNLAGRLSNLITNSTSSALRFIPAPIRSFFPFLAKELDIQAPTFDDAYDKLTGKKKAQESESLSAGQEVALIPSSSPLPDQILYPPLQPKTEILGNRGKYQIENVLEYRGQGYFYQAIQLPDSQPIIIKEYLFLDKNLNKNIADIQYNFERISGIELADGRIQDFRLITPWEAIAYEQRCYLIFKGNFYSFPTLRSYLEQTGAMSSIEVYRVLHQALQSLQFLHTQKFRLPSGAVNWKPYHGNLNLDSLLISTSFQGFVIYLCDLALWEDQFMSFDGKSPNYSPQQDLKDLGKTCLYLLAGNDQIDNPQNLPKTVDPLIKDFITNLIYGNFDDAEIARNHLPYFNTLIANNRLLEEESITKPDHKKNFKHLKFWIFGGLGIILLTSIIWLILKNQNKEVIKNQSPKTIEQVSGIPNGQFTYTSAKDDIWSYVITTKNLLPGGINLEDKLKTILPNLNVKYDQTSFKSDLITTIKSGKTDFGVTNLINFQGNPEFGYQEFAYDGLVVFVAFSKKGREQSLPTALNGKISLEQLRQIYTGKITNWQKLGGPNLPIKLYIPANNDAVENFEKQVLKTPEAINNFRRLIPEEPQPENIVTKQDPQQITQLQSFATFRAVIQDFENNNPKVGSISFDSLSKVFGQCSVYPLAIVDDNNRSVYPLIQKDGKPVTPQQTDLCNDKGNYVPNMTAFISQSYPLAYPLAVVYLRDNRREPIGEKFAEVLKTSEVQCLLKETGLVTIQPLGQICDTFK